MSTTFCCLVRFAGAGPDDEVDDDEAAETETGGGRLDSKFATICSALFVLVIRLSELLLPLKISASICLGIGLADIRDKDAAVLDVVETVLLLILVVGGAAAIMSCPEEEMGSNVASGTGEAINM